MTFIERHLGILTLAIAAMIVGRIVIVSDFGSFMVEGFDKGFLYYRSWLTGKLTSDELLASKISQAITRQRAALQEQRANEEIITGSTSQPPEEKADQSAAEQQKKSDGTSNAEASSTEKKTAPEAIPLTAPGPGEAEKTLLERLGLRRSELEKREEELLNREALLKAAEKRLEDRSEELKKLEADLKVRTEQRNAELTSLKPIVTMYENMKPKDAARIFDKIDFPVLLLVSTAMNPRKLSEVLAFMDPVLVGKLTKTMSANGRMAVFPATAENVKPVNELPDLPSKGTP